MVLIDESILIEIYDLVFEISENNEINVENVNKIRQYIENKIEKMEKRRDYNNEKNKNQRRPIGCQN